MSMYCVYFQYLVITLTGLMVMTLALVVYSGAQRRLRQELARQNATIPNQINHPTNRPTLRWVFQVLEGIERVRVQVAGQIQELITGLHAVKIKILRLFGEGSGPATGINCLRAKMVPLQQRQELYQKMLNYPAQCRLNEKKSL